MLNSETEHVSSCAQLFQLLLLFVAAFLMVPFYKYGCSHSMHFITKMLFLDVNCDGNTKCFILIALVK